MKRSPLAIVSLIAGSMIILRIVLIMSIDSLVGLGESHPLVVIAFPLIVILSLAELPLQMLNIPITFPVVLPLVSYLTAIASITRKEPRKSLAIAGIVLTSVGMAIIALL